MFSIYRAFINFIPDRFRSKYRQRWHDTKLRSTIIHGKIINTFRKPKYPDNYGESIYLHLGCGNVDHPAFVNIDAVPAPHIHYVMPIDNLSKFTNETVDLIYACHCLEHFSHKELPRIVMEWKRVLKIGGILRVSVPDFDRLLDIYKENSFNIDTIVCPLLGSHANYYDFHKAIFNEKSLVKLFMEAGFSEVRKWVPGSDALTTFDDWSSRQIYVNEKHYPVSLNMEGVK